MILTVVLAGGVDEEHHSLFQQRRGCHCRIHQLVVEVHVLYGQGHSRVTAARHYATPAVVVVLVPHIDDDAAVPHLDRLQEHGEGGESLV